VRIIAGEFRGRRIDAPPGLATRPMLDRVREALFSTLQPRLRDAVVLDLFAGSGVGLEALSRGARGPSSARCAGAGGARKNVEALMYAPGSRSSSATLKPTSWLPAVDVVSSIRPHAIEERRARASRAGDARRVASG
jgi:hypothetical protein